MAKKRTIVVSAVGKSTAVPDLVTVSLAVQVRGGTAQEALVRTNEKTQAAIAAFKQGGVADRDIATTNVTIWPQYGDDGRRVEAYQAQNSLSVRLRDVTQAGRVLDAVAGLIGDDIVLQGISFAVSEPEGTLDEARAGAISAARAKAEQLASAAGARVGQVLTISETAGSFVPVARPTGRVMSGLAAEAVPMEAGEQELTVSVEVTYRLEG
jgi:uncharacterized protein YggE